MALESSKMMGCNSPASTLDLLELPIEPQSYTVVTQSFAEVQDPDGSPAISMGLFLVARDQMGLLPRISIYSERGTNRERMRLLYMNGSALRVWKAMGMHPNETGRQFRPPRSAVLAFGMPFGE
ncbi:MAG: hypothetical protein NVS9B15_16450 [Acidobacteriaceae bacterium]